MKKLIIILLIFGSSLSAKEIPSSGEMMFDMFPIRPLGLVSLAVGTGFFVISLPFGLLSARPEQTIEQSARRLVIYPLKFTFQRPVGEFYGYMEEIEYVNE